MPIVSDILCKVITIENNQLVVRELLYDVGWKYL